MPLTFLLGGARSGKSRLAVRLAEASGAPVTFIATSEARDAEMAKRIRRHQQERPAGWRTIEEPVDLVAVLAATPTDEAVVIDCLSLWVSNLLERSHPEREIEELARGAAEVAAGRPGTTIAVSNEVGFGIVPINELARSYRDALGRVNHAWAQAAARSALVVAGLLLPLASPSSLFPQLDA